MPFAWWVARRTFTNLASTGVNVSVASARLNAFGSRGTDVSASFVNPSVAVACDAQTSTFRMPDWLESDVMVTAPIRTVSRLKNEITISTGPGLSRVV